MTDIDALSRELYANARDKGFYEHEDWLRRQLTIAENAGEGNAPHARTQLAEHFGNRLLLIVGEANEAHDELRSGRGVAELYFSEPGHPDNTNSRALPAGFEGGPMHKPEGVLAELADVAIRTLETMQSILDQTTWSETQELRRRVKGVAVDDTDDIEFVNGDRVAVGDIIALKHRYNLSRAPKHGGKAF